MLLFCDVEQHPEDSNAVALVDTRRYNLMLMVFVLLADFLVCSFVVVPYMCCLM
jgi:hypothetical protein